jgi:hypothetical protein
MGCPSCGRGFHSECTNQQGCVDCHVHVDPIITSIRTIGASKGAPIKNPEDVTDPLSTGRKRAAMQYPIFKDKPCEWRGKKNCGGGLVPIVGCINGFQRHVHHGPVKNTLRNEPTNVHRICNHCHNRWHAKNDPVYNEEEYEKYPHSPEPATETELLVSEAQWRIK